MLIGVALFIAALGVVIFFWLRRVDIRGFAGNVKSIDGETIVLYGVFAAPRGAPQDLTTPRDFSFKTDGSTQFLKYVAKFPTSAELQKTGGKFRLEDLPLVEGAGSLEDLKASVSIAGLMQVAADFPAAIQDVQDPVASRVVYRILSSPVQPLSPSQ